MPWKIGDVESHMKNLTAKQRRAWVGVANDALSRCITDGGDLKTCEVSAIKQANSVAKKVSESMSLREVGKMISAANMTAMKAAMASMETAMSGMKSMMDKAMAESFHEADLSLDDRMKAIRQAIETENPGTWVSMEDVFDTYVLYQLEPRDMGNGIMQPEEHGVYFKRDYSIDAAGSVTLGPISKVREQTTYMPVLEGAKESAELDITGETVMLIERAVRKDGTVPIKLIAPGWGSSGYYSKEVLQRDGPAAFPKGTQMFWDHQTAAEEAAKPEGSLSNLAAVFINGAAYQEEGKKGPGLYADARPFEAYKPHIEDMAADIGTSIRARGMATQGEAEGRKGAIIEKINQGISVDFVTKAGAGGQVVTMFEAARGAQTRIAIKENLEVFEVDEKEVQTLRETADKATKDNEALKTEVARLKEVAVLREARDFAAIEVGKSDLPDLTKARLIETVASHPVMVDGTLDKIEYAKAIEGAVVKEREYIAGLSGSGAIKGMSGTGSTNADADHKALVESYTNLYRKQGKSQDEAQRLAESAAAGR